MYQAYSPLMEVRAALGTTTNTSTGVGTISAQGVEIQKMIDEMTVKAYNDSVDFTKLLQRKSINQLSYIWNLVVEESANSGFGNSSFAFYTEAAGGAEYTSAKVQLAALCKGYRTDYAVSGLMQAGGMGNQLAEEASYALAGLAVGEERAVISGNVTASYGFASSFYGLLNIMGSYVTFTHTSNLYGVARANGKTYLDTGLVAATTVAGGDGADGASGSDSLALPDLDAAITVSNKRGGKSHRRVFLCSEDRLDEIAQLLQAQQRFTAPSLNVEGGMTVLTYKGIQIIGSRFMDKNGIAFNAANNDADTHFSHVDQAMYLIDLDYTFMAHCRGINARHVPISGSSAENRYDQEGGYFKTYGVLVMKRFDTSVLIYNLKDI